VQTTEGVGLVLALSQAPSSVNALQAQMAAAQAARTLPKKGVLRGMEPPQTNSAVGTERWPLLSHSCVKPPKLALLVKKVGTTAASAKLSPPAAGAAMQTGPGSTKDLTVTALMTPDMANFSGKVHGGAILKMLDQVAYACASRYCGKYVVTLSVDRALFKQQIAVGELVNFMAEVNYTGRTSMEVGIKVVAENTRARSQRHVMTSFFTMVAVDDAGQATEVPAVVPTTDDERRRFAAGHMRRQAREAFHRRYDEIREHHT
jgi:acyl-CoA hydrolase